MNQRKQVGVRLALVLGIGAPTVLGCTIQQSPPPQAPQQTRPAPQPAEEPPEPVAEVESEPEPPPPDEPAEAAPAPAYPRAAPPPELRDIDDLPPVYEGDLDPIPGRFKNFKTRQPLVCGGNEKITITNAQITTRNVAVIARGNCEVNIRKSFIRGRRIGVVALDRARVKVFNSRVVGRGGVSVRVSNGAQVIGRNSEFVGRIVGKLDDRGRNDFIEIQPPRRPRPRPAPPARPAPPPPPPEDALPAIPGRFKDFKTRRPVVCGGNEKITITNAIIDTRGVAVIARGRCEINLRKSFIRGRNIGIVAENRARVKVFNSRVVGRSGVSVRIDGGAAVIGRNTEFVGRIDGKLDDRGRNDFIELSPPPRPRPRPAPPADRPTPGRARGPLRCSGREKHRIVGERINGGRGVAIHASGRCRVEVVDSVVRGRIGIRTEGRAEVTVRRSEIAGRRVSVRSAGRSEVDARRSVFRGKVDRQGAARFNDRGGNTFQ